VQLAVGETESLALTLTPGAVTESVFVTASSLLDRVGTAASTSISERAIEDLPVRGRNFTEFVQLSPAVVQESDRFGLVISGQRSINSNVAIDGADFNDPLQGNQRGGNETRSSSRNRGAEFQVVRSGAGAEIGRTGAGFVNVVTKSGGNQLHGEAMFNLRNKALTSKDAFESQVEQQAGAVRRCARRRH
jgi:hypothetical protein